MAKESAEKSLLECWEPPDISTTSDIKLTPISFISTTYTFKSEFFEEECLSRFLSMETEKENDGVAFLIEREEKLASLRGGIVLVDQDNCNGERSVRWDLVPCRVTNGVMHAKITILHWSNCIRLIISSANLSDWGYCRNQEIFGVVDYTPNCESDLNIINHVLDYLGMLISEQGGVIIKSRFAGIRKELESYLKNWAITSNPARTNEIGLHMLFLSPKSENALQQLRKIWNEYSYSPPDQIYITSPFFDDVETPNTPSLKIFEILRQRGEVLIQYNVTTKKEVDSGDQILINAPEFLQKMPDGNTKKVIFKEFSEEGKDESDKTVVRPLHLKSIWLCNEDWNLFMIGSSNFTSAGLGLGKRNNYEANMVYCVSKIRNSKAYKDLDKSYTQGKDLDQKNVRFINRTNEDEEQTANEYLHLPLCFGEAVINKSEEKYFIVLNFNSNNLPTEFEISYERNKSTKDHNIKIFDANAWRLSSQKLTIELEWDENVIPDYLLVKWKESEGKAYWPVIIESQVILPSVEALRNLPLDALLQILSSSQPLHRLLKMIENVKNRKGTSDEADTVLDAHKLVNTSGFLLQRTRRVSYAIRAIRERLEKPVYTMESLNWRLYGPIGVQTLIDAISNEAKSNEEKKFLVAELALELSRVKPMSFPNSLKPIEIKAAIKKLLSNISIEFTSLNVDDNPTIETYAINAFKKAYEQL